jgi:transmembrane sensor
MSAPHIKGAADLDAEARDWLIRLQSNDADSEDFMAWEAWVSTSDAHRAAYREATEAWALASRVYTPRPTALELQRDSYTANVPVWLWRRGRSNLRLVWSSGAVAAALAALALGWGGWAAWEKLGDEPAIQFGTGVGENERLVLNDGSKVHLAALTKVGVDFARRRRSITLQSGEALFEVAHDRSRPFVVTTPLAEITAVGTAFDVHATPTITTVSVTEGVIRVDMRGGSGPHLSAGQQLVVDAKGFRVSQLGGGADAPPAWLQGRLEFRNQPLRIVLFDLNRYSKTPLMLGDAAAGDLTFTGTVEVNAIDDWVHGLPRSFPLDIESADGKLILRTKKS